MPSRGNGMMRRLNFPNSHAMKSTKPKTKAQLREQRLRLDFALDGRS